MSAGANPLAFLFGQSPQVPGANVAPSPSANSVSSSAPSNAASNAYKAAVLNPSMAPLGMGQGGADDQAVDYLLKLRSNPSLRAAMSQQLGFSGVRPPGGM